MFELDPFKKKKQKETGKRGVEDVFNQKVRRLGWKSYKFTSENNRGVSDRIVLTPGQVWFVEIKREGGALTPLQVIFLRTVKDFGLKHFVVYGSEGINEFIKEVQSWRVLW